VGLPTEIGRWDSVRHLALVSFCRELNGNLVLILEQMDVKWEINVSNLISLTVKPRGTAKYINLVIKISDILIGNQKSPRVPSA
jgi:hypothetical protein